MTEDMKIRVEVWPVAADSIGLWLLSGDDAWRSRNVPSDGEPHAEVEYLLHQNAAEDAALIHSTSWRVDGPAVILTYVAIVRVGELVRDAWPSALPINPGLPGVVGRPPTHAATKPPAPRYIDVLLHGVRHLRFLLDHDATNAAALDDNWRRHLAPITPSLATMYDDHHGLPN